MPSGGVKIGPKMDLFETPNRRNQAQNHYFRPRNGPFWTLFWTPFRRSEVEHHEWMPMELHVVWRRGHSNNIPFAHHSSNHQPDTNILDLNPGVPDGVQNGSPVMRSRPSGVMTHGGPIRGPMLFRGDVICCGLLNNV